MWYFVEEMASKRFPVRIFIPGGASYCEGTYATREEAAARVNYLNGGPSPEMVVALQKIAAALCMEDLQEGGPQ